MRHDPIVQRLGLDFDGVLHSYTSGWMGCSRIPDPPVDGAMRFLRDAVKHWEIYIHSCRSRSWRGRRAMRRWVWDNLVAEFGTEATNGHFVPCAEDVFRHLYFPKHKPPVVFHLDDRAVRFVGVFPDAATLAAFDTTPWWEKGRSKEKNS